MSRERKSQLAEQVGQKEPEEPEVLGAALARVDIHAQALRRLAVDIHASYFCTRSTLLLGSQRPTPHQRGQ